MTLQTTFFPRWFPIFQRNDFLGLKNLDTRAKSAKCNHGNMPIIILN